MTGTMLAGFGAKLAELSYGHIENATQEAVDQELNIVKNLGLSIFNIHVNYDPYRRGDKEKILLMDNAVKTIEEWGGTLIIADAGAESWYGKEIPWSKWKTLHINSVSDIASRYKPDYYVLVKEPRWYEDGGGGLGMISHTDTTFRGRENEEWAKFIPELSSAVKNVSPATKTVVALVPQVQEDQQLLPMINTISNLDAVGFDRYGGKYRFQSPRNLDAVAAMIPGTKGKEAMITETWSRGVYNYPSSEIIEAYWIRTVKDFMSQHKEIQTTIFFHLTARMKKIKHSIVERVLVQ